MYRKPGFPECLLEPRLALRADGLVGGADNEANIAMSEREQMACHGRGRLEIVDTYRQARRIRPARGNRNEGHLRGTHCLQRSVGIRQRRRQDDTRDAITYEPLDRGPFVPSTAFFQNKLTSRLAALLEDAHQQLVQISRARVAVQKSDVE